MARTVGQMSHAPLYDVVPENLKTKGPRPREKSPTIVGAQTDRYKIGVIYNPRGTDTHPHLGKLGKSSTQKVTYFLGGITGQFLGGYKPF